MFLVLPVIWYHSNNMPSVNLHFNKFLKKLCYKYLEDMYTKIIYVNNNSNL